MRAGELRKIVETLEGYAQAKSRALAQLNSPFQLGRAASRNYEDLYDRHGRSRAQRLASASLWDAGGGRMSTQVLQEFCVNVTRKILRPLSGAAAREVVGKCAWWVHSPITPATVIRASEIGESIAKDGSCPSGTA